MAKPRGMLGLAIAAAVFLLSILLYARTVAPTVTLIDSGELILAAYGRGVAHPPGFPLYLVVAHLATLIPIGSIALRVNGVSALFGALAAAVITLVAAEAMAALPSRQVVANKPPRRKTDRSAGPVEAVDPPPSIEWLPSLAAGLLLAFSRTLWAYATVAEVYTLNTLMILLVVLLMLRWRTRLVRAKGDGDVDTPLHAAAFVFGLALGVHHVTVGLMLPALALLVWQTAGRSFFTSMRLVSAAMFALAGVCIYVYLPLAASKSPLMNWGDPRTLQRLWWHITGKQYQVFLSFSGQALGGQFAEFLRIAAREFGPPWLPLVPALAVAGMVSLYRRNRTLFWFLLLVVISDLAYTLGYDIAEDKDAYFLPVFIATVIAAAFGAMWLIEQVRAACPRLAPIVSAVVAVVPVLALAANLPYDNRSRYFVATDYVDNLMAAIDPGGLLLTSDWQVYAPTLYTRDIEHRRSDVAVIDINLLRRSWYYAYLERAYPHVMTGARKEVDAFVEDLKRWDVEPELYAQNGVLNDRINTRFDAMVAAFIKNHQRGAPVYVTLDVASNQGGVTKPLSGYQLVPRGLVFQLSNGQKPVPPPPPINTRGLDDGTLRFDWDDVVVGKVLPVYTLMLYNNGRQLAAASRHDEARASYLRALKLDPNFTLARQALESTPLK